MGILVSYKAFVSSHHTNSDKILKELKLQTALEQDNMDTFLNATRNATATSQISNLFLQNLVVELHNYDALQEQQLHHVCNIPGNGNS